MSFSTLGLIKNQKNALKNKAKKLALSNTKTKSVIDVQEPKDNTTKSARIEVPTDSGVKKDNVENCVPLKKMKLNVRTKILASIGLRCKIVDFGNYC